MQHPESNASAIVHCTCTVSRRIRRNTCEMCFPKAPANQFLWDKLPVRKCQAVVIQHPKSSILKYHPKHSAPNLSKKSRTTSINRSKIIKKLHQTCKKKCADLTLFLDTLIYIFHNMSLYICIYIIYCML